MQLPKPSYIKTSSVHRVPLNVLTPCRPIPDLKLNAKSMATVCRYCEEATKVLPPRKAPRAARKTIAGFSSPETAKNTAAMNTSPLTDVPKTISGAPTSQTTKKTKAERYAATMAEETKYGQMLQENDASARFIIPTPLARAGSPRRLFRGSLDALPNSGDALHLEHGSHQAPAPRASRRRHPPHHRSPQPQLSPTRPEAPAVEPIDRETGVHLTRGTLWSAWGLCIRAAVWASNCGASGWTWIKKKARGLANILQ